MALVKGDLAKIINEAQGAKDKDDKAIEVTAEHEAYADAIITTLTTAVVSLPLVQGTAPPAPGPVSDLQASNGIFLPPLLPAAWLGIMSAGLPMANPAMIAAEAAASTSYLTTAQITFDVGTLTGNSTAAAGPPPVPGVLIFVNGSGGTISGLDGASWAAAATPPGGNPTDAEKVYQAIVDYLQDNAEVIFPAGTINGAFPAVGAPLVAGIGIGGMIV